MNNVDKQYLAIMRDILDNGNYKETRAGWVKSLFGKQMEFDLKEGLPLLTTKKVYYKGIIHELIWFLKGDINIKYLVDNNVHIWDDDAFRWFKTIIKTDNFSDRPSFVGEIDDDFDTLLDNISYSYRLVTPEKEMNIYPSDMGIITKERFLEYVKDGAYIHRYESAYGRTMSDDIVYTFGDLGPVYGKQWRKFGVTERDQIKDIIEKLRTNPDDRRMLCVAFNPDVLDEVALPPCHMMFQVYTRKLTHNERITYLHEHNDNKYDEWVNPTEETLDKLNVPKRELSMFFFCRSQDLPCGTPFNISQYAMLQYIIADICDMVPGKLIYFGGDVHIYENQFEGAYEQLSRTGFDKLPKFVIKKKLYDIDAISYDDFEVTDYKSDVPIKYPLNVG